METIIFIGIQATGKSTFYKERFFNSHMRVSIDLLNTRNKEQIFLEICFSVQQSFVIDNTNPTKQEREKYIKQAKDNKYKVIGYYFQSKIADSIERNNSRTGKAKIPEMGIKGTFNKLELPSIEEGFDEIYYVQIKDNKFVVTDWDNEI